MSYKIFIINLKKHQNQKNNIENILRSINFEEYLFYDGIDGLEIKETIEIKELFKDNDFGSKKKMYRMCNDTL